MSKYSLLIGVIVAGVLEIHAAGTMLVENGARLEGTGSIEGDVTFVEGATLAVDVTANDPLAVSGALDLGNATLELAGMTTDSAVTLIAATDRVTEMFKNLSDGNEVSLTGYFIHYINDGVNSQVLINKNSTPTSSGIDLRAYQADDGVYVEFVAFDVESDGEIRLALLDEQGAVVWQGEVGVIDGPEFIARFKVPGLVDGQSYDFKVRDEVGTWWTASGVKVGGFNTEMLSMTLSGATIAFDSIAGREYEVQWTASLSDEWQTVKTVLAEGTTTSVEVAFPEAGESAGFFRTQMR